MERAIIDAETLLNTSGATSGVDRIHTALHGYLLLKCEDAGIPHGDEPSLTDLYKQLRAHHPNLKREAAHGVLIDRILKGLAAILDSLNTLRNRASVAHPNAALLDHEEALLAINTARTALHYLASKLD